MKISILSQIQLMQGIIKISEKIKQAFDGCLPNLNQNVQKVAVPQIQVMRTAAAQGEREIINFIDLLLMNTWNEGELTQLCYTASQLDSHDQLEAKLKYRVFRFVTRRRKYLYLGYLKYKLANKEVKDLMLPQKYFLELRKEEISDVALSKSFFSRVLSSITPKKRKLKEQTLTVCLFEIPEVQSMVGLARLDEQIQDKIFDWADKTIQKQAEEILKRFSIEAQEICKLQEFQETSKMLNNQENFDHIQ